MDITRSKDYPEDYPSDAVAILDAMTMDNDLHLVGSMSLRSQQYAGDYDGYEVINKKGNVEAVLRELRERFQSNIKKLRSMPNVYIGDIKAGVVESWRVIPRTAHVENGKLVGYSSVKCRNKVHHLLEAKLITESEAERADSLLKDSPTSAEFLMAKNEIKFHILRWTVAEVLANKKPLRGGGFITLEEAFHTPGITKLDTIGLVQNNRFTDFSVIYEFRCNGKVLNPEPIQIRTSLMESIIAYQAEGNYFKVLKRLFALAKLNHSTSELKSLNSVLNSDLGRLYHIVGDMDTLLTLFQEYKRVPIALIRFEIDQFIQRLSTIYTLGSYLKKDDTIVSEIRATLKLPEHLIAPRLLRIRDELNAILQHEAQPYMEAHLRHHGGCGWV